ncbi:MULTISPECIES: SDR family oxidoreductase [unclassified Streptosporangium]|uniref:SDR family oxidoreductase n=1 Tax=unclassified Streptosporangium TaxID=2632669 RepID=UPI002E27B098|nr:MULTISPECIES: SDR family oxidoreductase [unclassified Streptosporangium]
MGTYAVTGSASGMGAAVTERLRAAGHSVIGVDLRDADIIADLATPEGRSAAAAGIIERSGGVLDGAVVAAGIGPLPGPDRVRRIAQTNYLGSVELLTALRPALAVSGDARAVVFGSNSPTVMPAVPRHVFRAIRAGNIDRAVRRARIYGQAAPNFVYAASKLAVTDWARRAAVTPAWAGAGIRLNVIAPGPVKTPLLDEELANPLAAKAFRSFPNPIGEMGDPGHLADWVIMMLSPAATFMSGSVVVVDGGAEAWFRAGDWPRPVTLLRLPRYLWRWRAFSRFSSPHHAEPSSGPLRGPSGDLSEPA